MAEGTGEGIRRHRYVSSDSKDENTFPHSKAHSCSPYACFSLTDIAEISIQQARSRYLSSAAANPTKGPSRFKAEFAALDCFSHSLSELPTLPIPPRAMPFDVVSMQFCMHYAFESVQKARLMLENVTRFLRKGGRFVGTIPNDKLLL